MKIWMTVYQPRIAELDWWLNYSMEEKRVSLLMIDHCSLSEFSLDWSTGYHEKLFVAYHDCSLFHFCGNTQYPLDVAWWMQDEFVMMLCASYFFVDGHQKVRVNFLAWQLQSCLSFSTSNKNWLQPFFSISS